jgi:hypothetical protein
MHSTTDLRILFPTSFSDACFRTTRAIAQLAESCTVSLTVAHVVQPGADTLKKRRELDSFMGEADHYDECRRILIESNDPAEAIAELTRKNCFDMILAPASDRLGLHSLFKPSLRAKLLKQCTAPVWTAGSCLDHRPMKQRIQTIACLVDFEGQGNAHLPLAAAFAARVGARMRLVHVIPPVGEETLARAIDSDAPLMPEVAISRLRAAFTGRPYPEIDVAIGDPARELPRLLDRCEADLAFVGPGQALCGAFFCRLAPFIKRLPCPVICVDGGSCGFSRWTFQQTSAAVDMERAVMKSNDYALVH